MTLGNEDTEIEVSEIVRNTVSHISLDGSGNISLNNNNIEDVKQISGNNGAFDFTSSHNVFSSSVAGADIRFFDTNGDEIFRAVEDTNDLQVPNGDITDGTNIIFDQSAGHVPSSIVETAGLDADTVDGFEADELRNSKNVAQLTSTNTTLDINQTSWTSIPFDVQLTLDAAYTHDASGAPETITFDEGGTYRVYVSLSYDGGSRVNPGIKFNVNGTRLDTFGLTGYIRSADGHEEASNTVSRIIDVNAGDTLEVQTIEMGDAGTVTMRSNESILAIEQLSSSVTLASDADTLDGLDSTAFVKTDGSTTITSTQAINQAEGADYLKLNNTTTGDSWDLTVSGTSSFDFDVNNNEVFTVDPATQQATFSSRLYGSSGFDAGGSSIDNSTEVNTTGSGSASFNVYDSANSQDLAVFNEGGNVEIPNGDLTDGTNVIYDNSATEVPQARLGGPASSLSAYPLANSDLSNSAVTVAGNSVSLGSSTAINHDDLSNIGSSDHHTKYTDSEARGAIESGDVNHISFENTETVSDGELSRDDSMGYIGNWGGNGMAVLWDSYNVSAGTHISISGGTGDESLPTISHGSTSSQGDVTTSGATVIDDIYVDGNGHVTNLNTQNRSITDWDGSSTFDADSVDGYDIQKNGTDGSGIINFKT